MPRRARLALARRSRFSVAARRDRFPRIRTLHLSLLRGVCQTPAYVAHERGFFAAEGLDVSVSVEPTASAVPARLDAGDAQAAVIPWTRAALAPGLVVVCGSGVEEAAVVVRRGLSPADVRSVSVPMRGGMKDLTAMGLLASLGWEDVEVRRQPSGDGAIISLFAQGCDAASMVEPYATALELLGVGTVVRRTGDVWPGAPGCSLTTTARLREEEPETVAALVRAYVRGVAFVRDEPDAAAAIAARTIGVHERFVREALLRNRPDADAIRNEDAMRSVLELMRELGYLDAAPNGFVDLSFLERAGQPVG